MKWCSGSCGRPLAPSEFSAHKGGRDGLNSECKACLRVKGRNYWRGLSKRRKRAAAKRQRQAYATNPTYAEARRKHARDYKARQREAIAA